MRKSTLQVLLTASILIFSSLAGCLGDDEEGDEKVTIMTSTYHVEQIVSAIVGDTMNVEILAPSNVPVHDFEPSADDVIRLANSDMFFYHGLGLETWVEAQLASMGDDAPTSFETHKLPTGQVALDYEGMLKTQICELLAEGPYETNELESVDYHADDLELHAEPVTHTLSYATHEHSFGDHDEDDHGDDHDDHGDDHDDHGDDHDDHGDDHDDHGDDHDDDREDHGGHDDHGDHADNHDGHNHAEAMEIMRNLDGCPSDTVVSIYELEEGEYVLEFETTDHDLTTFNMVALKMAGAHHHHHHGHGDGPFEWAGIFAVNDDTHTWTMEKVDGSYADPAMRVVIIPTDTPTEENMHSLEGGVEALIEGDCKVVEDGETMTPIVADGSCFELTVNGASDISSFTMDTAGISGFAAYTAHSPYEFEATQHYLKDSAGNDVEHIAEEGGGGHGDHGDHGDDHGDDHDDHSDDEEMTPEDLLGMLDSDSDNMLSWDEFVVILTDEDDEHHEVCHDADTHESHDEFTNQADCEAAGHVWMEDHEEEGCHDTTTHETHDEYTNQADCEAAGHMWMEGDDDHDNHGDDHDNHGDDHDDHMGQDEMDLIHSIWNESDTDMDGHLSETELVEFVHDMDILFEAEEGVGYATIHIEAEGEYGFAVPTGVNMYILMAGDAHEGHDDHSGHDDHGDSHDDHSDHGDEGDDHDEHGDEEALEYDPHSWLDPVAYKAQVSFVLDELKKAYPDNADTFQSNADAFMASLDKLDADFEAALGENGTCTSNSVAANHNAYAYMAYRYDIQFVTVHGLDPEGEPSAADIAKVVEKISEDEISVLYVEEYTDVSAVDSLVEQTKSDSMPNGVSVQILYTMELPPKDSSDNYLSLMQKNLDSLKAGLGC